jgi:pimeloyl-ACP methyl ester carboxylesterase
VRILDRGWIPVVALVSISSTFASACVAQSAPTGAQDCRIGFYRLRDRSGIDIGATSGTSLRWRRRDGSTGELVPGPDGALTSKAGWTGRPDGHRVSFSDCSSGGISVDGVAGRRVAFATRETTFQRTGVPLAGRLIEPLGAQRYPIVVLVHGSESFSARSFYALQRQLPAEGIGAFVYDKRGTGASAGTFTHDYHVLAADAAAAVSEVRRMVGARAGRIGFQGSSQGGWVAPLAASLTRVDFVVVGYGLAVSPFDEDDGAVTLDLTRHGFSGDDIPKALEIARAAQAIALRDFQGGYEEFDAVRGRYASEPWFRYVRGNLTQVILSQPREVLREQGPLMFAGILPHYDPLPVLRTLDTPQVWILGADDIDAPPARTIDRLRDLIRAGRPITTVVYPRAEHGLYEYETDAAGERLSTRQPATYLPLMVDFIRDGKIRAHYADSMIYR